MGGVPDIGARAELVPMDAHFEEISIGLYVRDGAALVHTYSPKPGARERIAFVVAVARGRQVERVDPVRRCAGEADHLPAHGLA